MKLKGKLNRQEIKSILHTYTSYMQFKLLWVLSKIDKFVSGYEEISITKNINDSIFSSHTVRNCSYLLQKHCISLTNTIRVKPPTRKCNKVSLKLCILLLNTLDILLLAFFNVWGSKGFRTAPIPNKQAGMSSSVAQNIGTFYVPEVQW